jgi:hypothetical protein
VKQVISRVEQAYQKSTRFAIPNVTRNSELEESRDPSPQRLKDNKKLKERKKERKKAVATLAERRGVDLKISEQAKTNYEYKKKLRTFVEETLSQLKPTP